MPEDDAAACRAFWEKTFDELKDRLIAYALWLVNGSLYDAEDLMHETVRRIFKYLKNPEEVRNPISYLFTIMRNIWSDKKREEGRLPMDSLDELLSKEAQEKQRRNVEPAVEPDAPRLLENDELRAEMRANQGPLIPREKLLLKLHLEGYTCKEIADKLGEDVRLVRSDLYAVIAKVRSRLKKRKR